LTTSSTGSPSGGGTQSKPSPPEHGNANDNDTKECKAKMTSPYCWICQSPAAVHVQGNSYVCADHAQGTGGHYLEGSIDD